MYDERWRWIGTFRESDSDPKEEYIPHQAGADGQGGSSYVDLVILRDRDGNNSEWTDAADGTMEERIYYCQNWRADVSAIVEDSGEMVEWVKYSAYGVPFGLPRGDTDSDGDCDATDRSNINGWSSGYDVRYDVDLDENIDQDDVDAATNLELGLEALTAIRSQRGYAGYLQGTGRAWHVRARVMDSTYGRWISRDPAHYDSSMTLYQYAGSGPAAFIDPTGMRKCPALEPTSNAATEDTPMPAGMKNSPSPTHASGWTLVYHILQNDSDPGDCDTGDDCTWTVLLLAQPRKDVKGLGEFQDGQDYNEWKQAETPDEIGLWHGPANGPVAGIKPPLWWVGGDLKDFGGASENRSITVKAKAPCYGEDKKTIWVKAYWGAYVGRTFVFKCGRCNYTGPGDTVPPSPGEGDTTPPGDGGPGRTGGAGGTGSSQGNVGKAYADPSHNWQL